MVQIIKYKCCGKVFAACREPLCYTDKDWLEDVRQYASKGCQVEMVESGTFVFEQCECKAKKTTVEFLQEITVTHVLERRETYRLKDGKYEKRYKYWKEVPLKQAISAFVIGERTLSDGDSPLDIETGFYYIPEHYFKALLVVAGMRKKPFFIPYPKG